MADEAFNFGWIPNNYGARVQRSAVLYPLLGPATSGDEIVSKTRRLVGMWRARLHALKVAGWRPGNQQGDLQYARNCPPTFVYSTPHTRQCRLWMLCPFCYARWVRQVWERVDATFPNPRDEAAVERLAACTDPVEEEIVDVSYAGDGHQHGRRLRSIDLGGRAGHNVAARTFPFHLLVRTVERNTAYSRNREGESYTDYATHLLSQLLEARTNIIRRMHTAGSFAFTMLSPGNDEWHILHREIHIVRAEYEIPEGIGGSIFRLECPTRRAIFQAVAHACKYPKGMLFGDVAMTRVALEARHRMRLLASYGVFRQMHRSL